MPTRYLKPGIRDSEAIDSVSAFAETLWCRLLVTVDDYGRTDARPAMIKAACFPVKKAATEDVCAKLLDELARADLVQVYTVDGKPYLQMQKWDNKPRANESNFPAPADGCAQVYASARKPRTLLPETETVTVTVTGTQTETGTETQTCAARDFFAEAWSMYPKRPGNSKAAALKAWNARIKAGADPETMIEGLRRYAAYVVAAETEPKFIKQAATFFGPGDHFLADWTPPPPGKPRGQPFMSQREIDRKRTADAILAHKRPPAPPQDTPHHDDPDELPPVGAYLADLRGQAAA